MNEEEWLTGADPQAMLAYLEGKASARKLRLFACACARRWWPLLLSDRPRTAVEAAERFADGKAPPSDLAEARGQAEWVVAAAPFFEAPAYAAALAAAADDPLEAARQAAAAARQMALREALHSSVPGADETRARAEADAAESRALCDLVRHVFGNPFRSQGIDPGWLRANGGAVAKVARVIYETGRYEDFPFLADALLDAGCEDERILAHCRLPDPDEHPRGCWLLDALLGHG
jgi:hypothetical protein